MKKGEMLNAMIVAVTNGHAGQYDKGGNPYILHPLRVMTNLQTTDEELQCIGIGHDYVEDVKGATYQHLIQIGCSERVVNGIRCLTKVPGETEEEYQLKVLSNIDSCVVKVEDLRDNSDIRRLKGVTEKDVERMVKYHRFYLRLQQHIANHT